MFACVITCLCSSSRTVKVKRPSLGLHRQQWASMLFGPRVLIPEMSLQTLVWFSKVWQSSKTCRASHMDVWCFWDSFMPLILITRKTSNAHLKYFRKFSWNWIQPSFRQKSKRSRLKCFSNTYTPHLGFDFSMYLSEHWHLYIAGLHFQPVKPFEVFFLCICSFIFMNAKHVNMLKKCCF